MTTAYPERQTTPNRANILVTVVAAVFVALSANAASNQDYSSGLFNRYSALSGPTQQGFSAVPAQVSQPRSATSRLIVLRNEAVRHANLPTSASEIVALATSHATAVLAALGNPKSVNYAIVERPNDEVVLAMKSDSAERRLLNYISIEYDSQTRAEAASNALRATGLFSSVALEEISGEFSLSPNDPYYSTGYSSPLNYQWGMNALNLPSAWNTQTGFAYLSILDNGIQRGHPDLREDRYGNVRAQLSGYWAYTSNSVMPSSLDFDESISGTPLGHGTHAAGIVAAKGNNGVGVSGVCWDCSLAVLKIGTGGSPSFSKSNVAGAVYGSVRRGVQAINLSFGFSTAVCDGSDPQLNILCDAIQVASDYDVALVAAAGNHQTNLQFPASDSRAISVGGMQIGGAPWNQTAALGVDSPARDQTSQPGKEIGTNFGPNQWVMAPARDILSTMYVNSSWNTRCGSVTAFNTSLPGSLQFVGPVTQSVFAAASGNLYGICTGTSMAAPHITGMVGLIRSTAPLLTTYQVKSILAASAGGVFLDQTRGYGTPNSATAIASAVASSGRLTPLYAMYNQVHNDYVYTVFPQMGAALVNGTVPPYGSAYSTSATGPYYFYSYLGNYAAPYPSFFAGQTIAIKPGVNTVDNFRPRARLKVFTTQKDAQGVALWPICRFSYTVGTVVRHLMDTAPACSSSNIPTIATLDGQEGYVYPPNAPQPGGTVAVVRMEKNPSGQATVFVFTASTDQAYYNGLGFYNPVLMGYAYLN